MDRLRAKGRRAWLYWRGDQQSAIALDRLRARHEAEVVALVSPLGSGPVGEPVSTALRPLIEEQAQSLGLPLHWVEPGEETWRLVLEEAARGDVRAVAFSCVSSDALRARGQTLAEAAGLEAAFPLYGEAPAELAASLLAAGFRSVVTRIDLDRLAHDRLGRVYSEAFCRELSPELDPLGEDGAFDTFVCGGPGLLRPISPRLLDMVESGREYRAILGSGPKRAYGDV